MEQSIEDAERLDADACEFLRDLNIVLGNEYGTPNLTLFSLFLPAYLHYSAPELPLIDRLYLSYRDIDQNKQKRIDAMLHKALWKCAAAPLGMQRSLACLELVRKIDLAIGVDEQLYKLLFNVDVHPKEKAEWQWQLIRRLRDWGIRIRLPEDDWINIYKTIATRGIYSLIDYISTHGVVESLETNRKLFKIAKERIFEDRESLQDFGESYFSLQAAIRTVENNFLDKYTRSTIQKTPKAFFENLSPVLRRGHQRSVA